MNLEVFKDRWDALETKIQEYEGELTDARPDLHKIYLSEIISMMEKIKEDYPIKSR